MFSCLQLTESEKASFVRLTKNEPARPEAFINGGLADCLRFDNRSLSIVPMRPSRYSSRRYFGEFFSLSGVASRFI